MLTIKEKLRERLGELRFPHKPRRQKEARDVVAFNQQCMEKLEQILEPLGSGIEMIMDLRDMLESVTMEHWRRSQVWKMIRQAIDTARPGECVLVDKRLPCAVCSASDNISLTRVHGYTDYTKPDRPAYVVFSFYVTYAIVEEDDCDRPSLHSSMYEYESGRREYILHVPADLALKFTAAKWDAWIETLRAKRKDEDTAVVMEQLRKIDKKHPDIVTQWLKKRRSRK